MFPSLDHYQGAYIVPCQSYMSKGGKYFVISIGDMAACCHITNGYNEIFTIF
jgi:hypothetical protein